MRGEHRAYEIPAPAGLAQSCACCGVSIAGAIPGFFDLAGRRWLCESRRDCLARLALARFQGDRVQGGWFEAPTPEGFKPYGYCGRCERVLPLDAFKFEIHPQTGRTWRACLNWCACETARHRPRPQPRILRVIDGGALDSAV